VALHLGEPGGTRVFDLQGSRLAAGDLAARTSVRLLEGEERGWATALRLDVKLPLGRPAEAGGTGGLDVGVGLAASGRLLSWLTGHAQLSLRRIAPLPGDLPMRLRTWQPGAEASLVAAWGEWAVLLESRWLGPVFQGGWHVLGPAQQGDALAAVALDQNQVSLGLRWRAVTAWFSEDFTPGHRPEPAWRWFYDTNAPDIALGVMVAAAF
jgi:hypothetical protein